MSAAAEKRIVSGAAAMVAAGIVLCLLAFDAALVWRNFGAGGFSAALAANARQGASSGDVWFFSLMSFVPGWLDGDPRLRDFWPMLSVAAAAFLGTLFYRNIRRNGWRALEAMPALLLLSGHAVALYAVAAGHRTLPIMIAAAAIVPCIRRLESVGDVQAEMGFGLALPLFLVASPQTATLVPLLAGLGALSDPLARRDARAFAAMFLVAILPTLIVFTALTALLLFPGGGWGALLRSWEQNFSAGGDPDWGRALTGLAILAPASLVPVLYCFMPDRRKQPLSALATLGLPLYLLAGRAIFAWDIPPWAPAGCFLASFGAWLSVARLAPKLRWLSLILLAAGAGASWTDVSWTIVSRPNAALSSLDGAWHLRPALED